MDMSNPENRRKYMEMDHATLDGKPARITGALCRFATVWQADNPSIGAEATESGVTTSYQQGKHWSHRR